MKRCCNCARAKEPDKARDLFPIRCTKDNCWVDYNYSCKGWVGAEDDGFITTSKGLKMIETVNEHCKHKDCRYRGRLSFIDEACFYMYYTGEPRRSPISECNRYRPGKIKWSLSLDGIRYIDDEL